MKTSGIHRQHSDVCGEHVMSSSMVRRWVRLFNEECGNLHDDPRSGRPSVVNDDLVRAVEEKFREKIQFTITSLSLLFFVRFHGHFFTILCLINFSFGKCVHAGCQICSRKKMHCIAGGIILR
jgi:hypothetical protein